METMPELTRASTWIEGDGRTHPGRVYGRLAVERLEMRVPRERHENVAGTAPEAALKLEHQCSVSGGIEGRAGLLGSSGAAPKKGLLLLVTQLCKAYRDQIEDRLRGPHIVCDLVIYGIHARQQLVGERRIGLVFLVDFIFDLGEREGNHVAPLGFAGRVIGRQFVSDRKCAARAGSRSGRRGRGLRGGRSGFFFLVAAGQEQQRTYNTQNGKRATMFQLILP